MGNRGETSAPQSQKNLRACCLRGKKEEAKVPQKITSLSLWEYRGKNSFLEKRKVALEKEGRR